MTLENYIVIAGFFAAAAGAIWLHRANQPKPDPDFSPVIDGEFRRADLAGASYHDALTVAKKIRDAARQSGPYEIHPCCNTVEAVAVPLGATRPPDARQVCDTATAAGGAVVQSTPASPPNLRTAAAYIMMHAKELDAVDRMAILAAVGGKGCVVAYYNKPFEG